MKVLQNTRSKNTYGYDIQASMKPDLGGSLQYKLILEQLKDLDHDCRKWSKK